MTWHAYGPATDEEIATAKREGARIAANWEYRAWRESLPWIVRIFTPRNRK